MAPEGGHRAADDEVELGAAGERDLERSAQHDVVANQQRRAAADVEGQGALRLDGADVEAAARQRERRQRTIAAQRVDG